VAIPKVRGRLLERLSERSDATEGLANILPFTTERGCITSLNYQTPAEVYFQRGSYSNKRSLAIL